MRPLLNTLLRNYISVMTMFIKTETQYNILEGTPTSNFIKISLSVLDVSHEDERTKGRADGWKDRRTNKYNLIHKRSVYARSA
jgi:hypothetical protein